MFEVSARPSTCGPIRTPPNRNTTTCGIRGPGSTATTIGASAATSATATRSSSPRLRSTAPTPPAAVLVTGHPHVRNPAASHAPSFTHASSPSAAGLVFPS